MKNVEDLYPLSPMQEGMMFHTLYAPRSGAYAIHISSRIEGDLNIPAFKRAWQTILDRHSILRSSLLWGQVEKPLQVVKKQLSLTWEEMDWRDQPAEQREQQIHQYLDREHRLGFDLSQAPLMRMGLIRLADSQYHFVWHYSHCLLDGWSVNIIFSELFFYYRAYLEGGATDLPHPRPYREFIAWLQQQDKAKAEAFWRKTLQGFTSPTPLGIQEKATGQKGHESEYQETAASVSKEATLKLRAIARQHRFTLTTFFQGTWAWLLSHYSGMREVVFGVAVTGRPVSLKGVEQIVGLLVNTLPARVKIRLDQPLVDWLKAIHDHQVEIREYGYCSLIEVKRWSDIHGAVPLFDSLVVFENHPVAHGTQDLGGCARLLSNRVLEASAYPISVVAEPRDDGMALRVHFDATRFSPETAATVLDHIKTILESMAEKPGQKVGQLSLLSAIDRQLRQQCDPTELENIDYICQLAPLQEEMLQQRLAAGNGLCLDHAVFKIQGSINRAHFENIWHAVIRQHDALRTSVFWRDLDRPVQVVYRRASLAIEWLDWKHRSEIESESALREFLEAVRRREIKAAQVPPLQVSVLQFAGSQYRIVLSYDPLLLDGWSVRILMHTLLSYHAAAATGQRLPPIESRRPYRDYVEWLYEHDYGPSQAFWQLELNQVSSPRLLHAALPAAEEPRDSDPDTLELSLPPVLVRHLRRFATINSLSLHAIITGAWAVLVSRYTSEADVLFGLAFPVRPRELPGAPHMLGNFMRTVPLQLLVHQNDLLLPWLKDVQNRTAESLGYSYSPQRNQATPQTVTQPAPLFDHIIAFEDIPDMEDGPSRIGTMECQIFPHIAGSMKILVTARNDISLTCTYSQDAFETVAVQRMLGHFQQLIEDIAGDTGLESEALLSSHEDSLTIAAGP